MFFGAKSAIKYEELLDRKTKGCNFIELHSFEKDVRDLTILESARRWLDELNMTAYCFHAPLDYNQEGKFVIGAAQERSEMAVQSIKDVIDAAAIVCNHYQPIVVVHLGTTICQREIGSYSMDEDELLRITEQCKKELLEISEYASMRLPDAVIAVENNPKFFLGKNGVYLSYFGDSFDLPELIESLDRQNIGLVLDVCHAQNTLRTSYVHRFGKLVCNDDSIEGYIDRYAKKMLLLHLSNTRNFGETKDKHGLPFLQSELDYESLTSIFASLEKNGIDCPITIEVEEQNFGEAKNFETTILTIKSLFQNSAGNKKTND